MKRKHIWLTVAILYCVAIFITTASPSSTGGNTLSILTKLFHLSEDQARLMNVVFRKSVHLTAFGVLAILFYNSFDRHRFAKAWVFTTMYAATDELHQAFLPNRTGAVIDVGIDSLGALLALLLVALVRGILKGSKKYPNRKRQ